MADRTRRAAPAFASTARATVILAGQPVSRSAGQPVSRSAGQPRSSREFEQAVMDFGMFRLLAVRNAQRARQLAGPAQIAQIAQTAQAALAQDDSLRQAKASPVEQGPR
ncbi:hypothetical protein [Streptomyces sp. VNUA24]|uniref:hypothetical protein n=1 Tax=Streptomyces sp. VNUA24 TaxID=3031131 RepID=UPI0023B81921|nr:hypothetical protein [Streptomyces sp. VNUA24]WEH12383.1 hypothetical protein PYR72_01220 [Streptomyces sp. VNUA24]